VFVGLFVYQKGWIEGSEREKGGSRIRPSYRKLDHLPWLLHYCSMEQ